DKKTAKKSRVKAFVKLVNYQHLMSTRSILDVDRKDVVVPDILQSKGKKATVLKETEREWWRLRYEREEQEKKTEKKSKVKAFVKLVNYQYLMSTRSILDVDWKDVVVPDILQLK
ncbi:hypothetical protein RYX36_025257, partial [Vicia faba]